MARFVLITLAILALYFQSGEAVRCWTCASEINYKCNDPIQAGQAHNNAHNYQLTNCDASASSNFPYLSRSKSVCKTQKQYVNGQLFTLRGCFWKSHDDYSRTCAITYTRQGIIGASSCEICETDGCNGA